MSDDQTIEYNYLKEKARMLCALGASKYSKNDAFGYPLKEWDDYNIDNGALQIAKGDRGEEIESCIELKNLNEVKLLMRTFHFDLEEFELIMNDETGYYYKVLLNHLMTKAPLMLYFKLKEK